jgi:hypothetical protein
MLSPKQVDQFVVNGFVRIDRALPRDIAGLAALWRATGRDPHNPATWTRPVIRLGPVNDRDGTHALSFRPAANTPVLYDAFDQLVGPGRWHPRPNVGLFVVRFPSRLTLAISGDMWMSASPAKPPIRRAGIILLGA